MVASFAVDTAFALILTLTRLRSQMAVQKDATAWPFGVSCYLSISFTD